MNATRILVPIDYSDHSVRALHWGASLAEKYGAQLVLLHVISKASKGLPEPWAVYSAGRPAPSPPPPEEMMVIDLVEIAQNDLKDRTLTNLYNDRPTWLANAHKQLDDAVLDAYGWDRGISGEQLLAKLLALNLAPEAAV